MRFEQECFHPTLDERHKMIVALIAYFRNLFRCEFEVIGHRPILPKVEPRFLKPQFMPALSIAYLGLPIDKFVLPRLRSLTLESRPAKPFGYSGSRCKSRVI